MPAEHPGFGAKRELQWLRIIHSDIRRVQGKGFGIKRYRGSALARLHDFFK